MFQKDNTNVSSCGRWASARIILKKYDLDEFKKTFKGPKAAGIDSDDVVTMLTMLKIDNDTQ